MSVALDRKLDNFGKFWLISGQFGGINHCIRSFNYYEIRIKLKYEIRVRYKSPILGQLLDLMSPSKINLFDPRFKSYNPWDMANCLL